MKRILIVLSIVIVVLGAIFSFLYFGGSSLVLSVVGQGDSALVPGAGLIGKRLPQFNLSNLAGKQVRSADLVGTPLVIMFWSTWNTQSADEIHILDQYLSSQKSLVRVVAINSQEDSSVVSTFMHRGGYRVETLLDTRGLASENYAIKGMPAFYFIDRTGVIREVHSGVLSQDALMNMIEKILP
ncbi:MAG: TlpA disulfide reductase family protein [Minisyncoccia bacterium]